MTQSIEPNIADIANGWLKSYKLDYKLEQESLNIEIDKALSDYFTKNGGAGANRPDAKLLLQDKNLNFYPILIEYKGYKDKLVKLDNDGQVENKNTKNEPNFKNINSFAVNGAVHYANALLHHTSYTDIIAIGMTGFREETGKIQHEIGVYFVSKSNLGAGQKVDEFSDLSFLKKENFDGFIEKVKSLSLTEEEIEKLKKQREKEIDTSLVRLNNDIYQNEKGLGENDRVYLVAASIIATLGIPGKVAPLEKADLRSSTEKGNTDGEIMMRKIKAFLGEKKLPEDKKELILRTLQNTLTTNNINKVENGESQLKRVFSKIVDDLGIYYKIGLTTDFTGKLFNEMYGWLGFSQDKLNDVVLTPSYVATLLVKLARVNKDSFVWDFATGSAGLLVAAMNEMINDAKNSIKSPDALAQKELTIKTEQLLGLELLSSVYMLAILNMILMGDGSSNILNQDSLKDFDGKYGFGKTDHKFPADAFVLNPPYSASGKGMNFVEKALNMMNKGYASIIIQNSAGSGEAKEYNKRILQKHTLIASIKMPMDLFIGKSSVQTSIYVFKVNEKHHKDEMVKFIDFSNDGYTRTNRKKASNNLKDTGRAKERYEELVELVRFGKSKLNIFTENEYFENTIDPQNGADWNQSALIETQPTLDDFKKTVGNYLAWEVSNILKTQNNVNKLDKKTATLDKKMKDIKWGEYRIGDIFEIGTGSLLSNDELKTGKIPRISAKSDNNGVIGYFDTENLVNARHFENFITVNFFGTDGGIFYHPYKASVEMKVHTLKIPNIELNTRTGSFIAGALKLSLKGFSYGNQLSSSKLKNLNFKILLPTKNGKIDFDFMEQFIAELEAERIAELEAYLLATGLKK